MSEIRTLPCSAPAAADVFPGRYRRMILLDPIPFVPL
jgi:hypothetical protein